MDLRQFYRKIREVKATIPDEFVYIASAETTDGGRVGIVNEVTRDSAARLIVEGKAVMASQEQIEVFHSATAQARQRLDKAEMARRIQVAIISDQEDRVPARKPPAR